jgi:hypothetical protein
MTYRFALFSTIFSMAGFVPSYAQQPADATTTPLPLTAGSTQEITVGNLGFTIKSLRVAGQTETSPFSIATVAIQVVNKGATPIALDYKKGAMTLTDEHGYIFDDHTYGSQVVGIGVSDGNSASVDYVIDPGQTLGIQCHLSRATQRGQTVGQNFDFAGEFIAFQDMGEGKVKALRNYPVSIVGIQKTPVIRGAIEGVGDQVKHGFSSIFGH